VSPSYGGIFDVDGKRSRLTELAERTEDPALWSDPVAAKKVMQEKSRLEREVDQWD
jgi:peptide chain release factor 2